MIEIIPAIIAKDTVDLDAKIEMVRGFAQTVQIDVGDGQFVDSRTWPITSGSPLDLQKYAGVLEIEVHLMIRHPEDSIREWLQSGVRRFIVHEESTEQFGIIADAVHEAGRELGVALRLETPVRSLGAKMDDVRIVQLMGIAEIGFQGHAFEESVIPKIEEVRTVYPDAIIEIDGGVTLENVPELAERGVTRFVVGSGIFKAPDMKLAYEQFMNSVKK